MEIKLRKYDFDWGIVLDALGPQTIIHEDKDHR